MGNCQTKKAVAEPAPVAESRSIDVTSAPKEIPAPDEVVEQKTEPATPEKVEEVPEQETEAPVEDKPVEETEVKETTIPTEVAEVEVEKPKGFMDKVDAFRDSCCGVSGGAEVAAAATTTEVVDNPAVTEEVAETPAEKVEESKDEEPVAEPEEPEAPVEEVPVPEEKPAPVAPTPSFRSPNFKQKRKLKKKLREIEAIEQKDPATLSEDQKQKLATKDEIVQSLAAF